MYLNIDTFFSIFFWLLQYTCYIPKIIVKPKIIIKPKKLLYKAKKL